MVENWAESATTLAPHTSPIASTRSGGPPNATPIPAEQRPEIASARALLLVRPQRSLRIPAIQLPAKPAPIAAEVPSEASARGSLRPRRSRLSEKNSRNQVHIA